MTARRTRTVFACTECGAQAPKWAGRCPECSAWNALVEEVVEPADAGRGRDSRAPAAPVLPLAEVDVEEAGRIGTGFAELDRLLGGGIVAGGLYLVGGEPGVGKSTLLLQVAQELAASGRRVLYLAGEESPAQIRLRAERLARAGAARNPAATNAKAAAGRARNLLVAPGTAIDALLAACDAARPEVLICDSIQTMYDPALSSAPGSVSQVRAAAGAFQRLCKARGTAAFLIGHVTRGGGIAGPKTLEHVVDAVLLFEGDVERDARILRAQKNRFGSTREVAIFTMAETGLEPVDNPSAFFLDPERRARPRPGSAHVASLEGSRPLVIEIQALVAASPYGTPQRVAGGFDGRRLALLLAVLERRADVPLVGRDVFLNVVGGLTLGEPAVDLGVVVALASSQADRPVAPGTIVFGEVGLTGEVRPVRLSETRIEEAGRLGFTRVITAAGSGPEGKPYGNGSVNGLAIETAGSVRDAIALALGS